MKLIKKVVKKGLEKMGIGISFYEKSIKNVFKTSYSKNVLLSFLPETFNYKKLPTNHTVYTECFLAAKIFEELGFNVDVFHYLDQRESINFKKYSAFYGFGFPLENAIKHRKNSNTKFINYLNGAYTGYSNRVSLERVKLNYTDSNFFFIEDARTINYSFPLSHNLSDCLIILGNSFTTNTYSEFGKTKIKNLPAFFLNTLNLDVQQKNFTIARKNFLWFGSKGVIHKGLDLLIEIFSNRPELNLHICGPIEEGSNFFKRYANLLLNKPNIKFYKTIDIQSPFFETLMLKCAFVIYPSVSEGGCVAVLTVMGNGGLIPIISEASGLDVKPNGLVFNNINTSEIEKSINQALEINIQELNLLSSKVQKSTKQLYTQKKYHKNLKQIIADLLSQES